MEIRDLKVGDRFIKPSGHFCELLYINDMRARVRVFGLKKTDLIDERFHVTKERVFNQDQNFAPGCEVIRVLEASEVIPNSRLQRSSADRAAATNNSPKEGGNMEGLESSKKVLAFSAKLPASFSKEFKGKKFNLHRTGEDKWEVNDKLVGGIRAAMLHILETDKDSSKSRTADHFFHCGLVEKKAAAAPKAEKSKLGKDQLGPRSSTPIKAAKKAKSKKASKKAAKSNGKGKASSSNATTLKFSKAAQVGKRS